MIDAIRDNDPEAESADDKGDFLVLHKLLEEQGAGVASKYVDRFRDDTVFVRRAHTMIWARQNIRLAPVYDATAERKMKIL